MREEGSTGPDVMREWVVSMWVRIEEVRSEANKDLSSVGETGDVDKRSVGQAGRLAKCSLSIWDMENWQATGLSRALAAPTSARSFPMTPQCEGTFCKCVWRPRVARVRRRSRMYSCRGACFFSDRVSGEWSAD